VDISHKFTVESSLALGWREYKPKLAYPLSAGQEAYRDKRAGAWAN